MSVRHDPEAAAAYDVLHEGVPGWMRAGALAWLNESLLVGRDGRQMLRLLEQRLRWPLDWSSGLNTAFQELSDVVWNDDPRAVELLDAVLMLNTRRPAGAARAEALGSMLLDSASAWEVRKDPAGWFCLERRVDETVEASARATMTVADNAGHSLHLAWHRTYGIDVDASGAYREAVRAVEAAAKPVVTPHDQVATLGKMIQAMADKPTKWVFELGDVVTVIDMLRRLWKSQLDRHGTDDDTQPLSVTPAQAEAAVHLAVTLVHWFRNGHVRTA